MDVKLDGERLVVHFERGNGVSCFTRRGNDYSDSVRPIQFTVDTRTAKLSSITFGPGILMVVRFPVRPPAADDRRPGDCAEVHSGRRSGGLGQGGRLSHKGLSSA